MTDNNRQGKTENEGRKHALRFAGFVLLFCAVFFSLQYLLTPDYDAYSETGEPYLDGGRFYTRIMEHELYSSEENIDLLMLGSSHIYWQYDPEIIDEYLGVHSFNAGTSAQQFDTGYALLVEAGKRNDIKTVIFEICSSRKGVILSDRQDLSQIYIVSDYMHMGLNKIRYLLNASGPERYVNSFFPLLRNKQNYLDRGYITNVIRRKLSKEYRSYSFPDEPAESGTRYIGRGYLERSTCIPDEDWKTEEVTPPVKDDMFSEDEKKSLMDTVNYCREHGIKLILVSTPLTDFNLAQFGNYDTGREQIVRFAEENDLEFYDFNLCRPEYFTCESDKFFDRSHMNRKGAVEYSRLLGRFFSGEISEDELFYDSYADKLKDMGNRVFGLKYTTEETDKEKIMHLEPIASAEFPVYVNATITSADGKETAVLEKQLLEDIRLDKGETIPAGPVCCVSFLLTALLYISTPI